MSFVDAYRDGDVIVAPFRAEADGGQTVGDGMTRLSPGDPGYDLWDRWLRSQENRTRENRDRTRERSGGWAQELATRHRRGRQ